uniref:Cation_ATPase_C domain-containing protein n=1 Tax=Steinernema glaseri TaxID=37863 RepID=A0A1I7ZGN3_9BILA
MWRFVTPFVLLFAIFFQLWGLKPMEYGGHTFPLSATHIGWALTSLSLIPIPVYFVYKFLSSRKEGVSAWKTFRSISHGSHFEPALLKYHSVRTKVTEADDDVFP